MFDQISEWREQMADNWSSDELDKKAQPLTATKVIPVQEDGLCIGNVWYAMSPYPQNTCAPQPLTYV